MANGLIDNDNHFKFNGRRFILSQSHRCMLHDRDDKHVYGFNVQTLSIKFFEEHTFRSLKVLVPVVNIFGC